ncbi:MAG: nitroreductase family protein [Candidatus Ratteibacteria bacterium]|nr:nitroreductase family protein [Candidatus Ratteibacteria bacterium]
MNIKTVYRIMQLLKLASVTYVDFTKETISALRFKVSEQNDDEFLIMRTTKLAHLVEKYIMLKPKNVLEQKQVYNELSRCLEELYLRGYESLPQLKWAQNIRWEFINYYHDVKNCPMTGKFHQKPENRELLEIIKQRRSVRKFIDKKLEPDIIEQLISSAEWAPTACNQQGLKYLIINDPTKKKLVSESIPGGKLFAHTAPVILIVLADKRGYRLTEERFTPYQDSAAAIQNILLTAEYLGLGACWCTYTSYSSVLKESDIRKLLKIPDYLLICGAIAIGYPSQSVCVVTRGKSDCFHNSFPESY